MNYSVSFEKDAAKTLRKLDRYTRAILMNWIRKNLVETDDPRRTGKALVGKLVGLWRYRVGDYRILAKIKDKEVTILIVKIGRRKDIYEG